MEPEIGSRESNIVHLAVKLCGRDICKLQPGGGDSAIDGGVVHNQDLQRAPESWKPFWKDPLIFTDVNPIAEMVVALLLHRSAMLPLRVLKDKPRTASWLLLKLGIGPVKVVLA